MTSSVRRVQSELDPALRAVADAVEGAGLPPMIDLAPGEARERIRAALAMCAPGPEMSAVDSHAIGDKVSVRIYRPLSVKASGTVVHFHGGGWVTGDFDYADATCRLLADAAGVPVVSVDYRLAPEHQFPAAVDDASAVLRWVAAGSEGLDPRIVVTGDSAGGNLAAVCAQTMRTDSEVSLVGQVLVYPVVDADLTRDSYVANSGVFLGSKEMQWFFDHYCPEAADRNSPSLAPIRAADLAGLPPAIVVVGGHDPLLDEGLEYAERLTAAGVSVELLHYPTLPHGFLQFTAVSADAREAAATVASATARLFEDADLQTDSIEGVAHA
ncbi:alpha/beta hydrolase [Rhodococcus sp. IEGM 1379]|uniref:alpha/beta hydrolase n=1 Tax=Rhodococcus sp. IEGM 1379 TaxID=3047086 RepID=UPI0024B8210A|nr:alpha/beta hydrolase [Rhodococcus sp. IEGM 1379]MDI9915343.1 alpha/beta hydrolase [Rhodococcus sp. IEGM 1379]